MVYAILPFLIVKTHLGLIFLGSNLSWVSLVSFACFFYRLISGKQVLIRLWSIRSGQPRFFSTGFIRHVWLARRRLFTTQPFYHLRLRAYDVQLFNSQNCHQLLHLLPSFTFSSPPFSITSANQSPSRPTIQLHFGQSKNESYALVLSAYLILVNCKRLWPTCFICIHSTHIAWFTSVFINTILRM
jgi:hypothetical protein